jgi:hypothetical protein
MRLVAIILCVLSAMACSALAGDRIDVCATYMNSGKSYHVQAISTTGSELNSATHTFDYQSWSKYVVIFWAENQATVIEMGYGYYGIPGIYGSDGTDQENRPWSISSYSPYKCGGY